METNISEHGSVHDIKNDIVDRLKRDKNQSKYSYQLHLEGLKQMDPGIGITNIFVDVYSLCSIYGSHKH
jgi:hypothetical protein